jgi:ABC-type transporter Mla MlaB component
MPPLIFAHLGHWYISLPVFMGPVLVLVVALKIQTWRDRRARPEQAAKHSKVTVTEDAEKMIVAVSGPLDYPAVVEIEIALGNTQEHTTELLLDLSGLTTAQTESVWLLCDAVGREHLIDHVSALVSSEPAMETLRAALAAEGITTATDLLAG